MNDAPLWHPCLRINRVVRVMLHTHWSAEAWPQVKAEFTKALALRSQIRRAGWFNYGGGRVMARKADNAMLADVKLVLSAPMLGIHTRRSGYSKAQVAFVSARNKFMDRATSSTWTGTVEAARRLHAEAKRVRLARDEREREAAASRAFTDEGGEA